MQKCSLKALSKLTIEDVDTSIKNYCEKHGRWVRQYDTYYWNDRLKLTPTDRMIKLLSIVRGSGWNMNRKGQCDSIENGIKSKAITDGSIKEFWDVVDDLPNIVLRDLPFVSTDLLFTVQVSFNTIQKKLGSWHGSADTLCFITKVILMFNWGQTPAFDSNVSKKLHFPSIDKRNVIEPLMNSLVDIGAWVVSFEHKNQIKLDEYATNIMKNELDQAYKPLPLGRSFDMLMFSLES